MVYIGISFTASVLFPILNALLSVPSSIYDSTTRPIHDPIQRSCSRILSGPPNTPPTAFLYPYTYRILFTFTSYSPVDLFCFPPWIHVHPRFLLTPLETSTIVIIKSYPTSLYFHSAHSWYVRLLHRSSICVSRFLAWFLVHSSSPVDPSIKFTCTLFHEFISRTRHRFFHIHNCMRILPQILVYEIIKRAPGWSSSHDELEPKRATAHGSFTPLLLPYPGKVASHFRLSLVGPHEDSSNPVLGCHSSYLTHPRNYPLMWTVFSVVVSYTKFRPRVVAPSIFEGGRRCGSSLKRR